MSEETKIRTGKGAAEMRKSAASCQIIGGADGPTTVFIAGKEKNLRRRIIRALQDRKNRRKRDKARRSIVPGTHTIQEVLQYAKERYGMVEMDSSYRGYEERKRSRKQNLIYRKRPELLQEEKRILPPKDFRDEKALKEYTRQVMEWTAMRDREIDAIPQEVFPTDYHLFVSDKGMQGTLEMEIDMLYEDIAVSYFGGNGDTMKAIVKDIYRYYGVSQEDIDHNTERYRELLMALSM